MDMTEKDSYSPLMLAAAAGDLSEVRRLLASGARVNERGIDGFTALFFAAAFNREEIVSELLSAGARTSLKTVEGDTPLSIAAAKGFWPVVLKIARAFRKGPPGPRSHWRNEAGSSGNEAVDLRSVPVHEATADFPLTHRR